MNKLIKHIIICLFVSISSPASEEVAYGKLYSAIVEVFSPTTVEQVQALVREAKSKNQKISIKGAGMSQGKQYLLNGSYHLDLQKINHMQLDGKVLTVGAGAMWHEIQKFVNGHGLALQVMQGSNIFSVGGSLSVNCHGWDFDRGSIVNTVEEISLINADGDLVRLSPKDELFSYVIGGYGCFGVIVEAKIQLTDNDAIYESSEEISVNKYLDYFNQKVKNSPDILLHRYRLSMNRKDFYETGIATNYKKMGEGPVISDLTVDESVEKAITRALFIARNAPFTRPLLWKKTKKRMLKENITSRNAAMSPPTRFHFAEQKKRADWLQEFFISGEELPQFLNFLGALLQENNVDLLSTTIRYVKAEPQIALSYTPTGDRFAVVLFFNQDLSSKAIDRTRIWVQRSVDYLIAHGGTYYLPYQHFPTAQQFRICYPKWEKFKGMKIEHDPSTLFSNGFYEEYFSEKKALSPLRQAFDEKLGVQTQIYAFLHHIFYQLRKEKFFFLMQGILSDDSLTDQEIYSEMLARVREAKGNPMGTAKRKLRSLKNLKKELRNLLHEELPRNRSYNGYIEIGYPGRMVKPLRKIRNIQSPIYAVSDQDGLGNYLEAGFPLPYNKRIPLNQFSPIPDSISPDSVELVSCFVGLHHIKEEKVELFLSSIHRVMKKEGIFILMDHDVADEKMQILANAIHTIFNAGMGVNPEANTSEIRNFHSLAHWTKILEKQGFQKLSQTPLIRNGDSTKNSILLFKKK